MIWIIWYVILKRENITDKIIDKKYKATKMFHYFILACILSIIINIFIILVKLEDESNNIDYLIFTKIPIFCFFILLISIGIIVIYTKKYQQLFQENNILFNLFFGGLIFHALISIYLYILGYLNVGKCALIALVILELVARSVIIITGLCIPFRIKRHLNKMLIQEMKKQTVKN